MYPKKEKSTKQQRNFRLPDDLIKFLETESKKHGVTQTTVLETALRKQMEATV